MTQKPIILQTSLPLPLFIRGKTRDTYDLLDKLLIVTTDRISAFDVVLPSGIPDKGRVLNQCSAFWFQQTQSLIPNHVIALINKVADLEDYLVPAARRLPFPEYLAGRSMIVKKAKRLPVECIVRGYLSGSAWSEYQNKGTVAGLKLPSGLTESQELPQPLFTPTTKADAGHDEPMSLSELDKLLGARLAAAVQSASLAVYKHAREFARGRGFIIADTKMEFGQLDEQLILIDELLTPDSSRFWEIARYRVGQSQPSYDKQPVRDWLVKAGWNKEPPAPVLPDDVIAMTAQRYRQVYERLSGQTL
jgi:phosphoribosylaminoimidazole-succinocarboxamide synthase